MTTPFVPLSSSQKNSNRPMTTYPPNPSYLSNPFAPPRPQPSTPFASSGPPRPIRLTPQWSNSSETDAAAAGIKPNGPLPFLTSSLSASHQRSPTASLPRPLSQNNRSMSPFAPRPTPAFTSATRPTPFTAPLQGSSTTMFDGPPISEGVPPTMSQSSLSGTTATGPPPPMSFIAAAPPPASTPFGVSGSSERPPLPLSVPAHDSSMLCVSEVRPENDVSKSDLSLNELVHKEDASKQSLKLSPKDTSSRISPALLAIRKSQNVLPHSEISNQPPIPQSSAVENFMCRPGTADSGLDDLFAVPSPKAPVEATKGLHEIEISATPFSDDPTVAASSYTVGLHNNGIPPLSQVPGGEDIIISSHKEADSPLPLDRPMMMSSTTAQKPPSFPTSSPFHPLMVPGGPPKGVQASCMEEIPIQTEHQHEEDQREMHFFHLFCLGKFEEAMIVGQCKNLWPYSMTLASLFGLPRLLSMLQRFASSTPSLQDKSTQTSSALPPSFTSWDEVRQFVHIVLKRALLGSDTSVLSTDDSSVIETDAERKGLFEKLTGSLTLRGIPNVPSPTSVPLGQQIPMDHPPPSFVPQLNADEAQADPHTIPQASPSLSPPDALLMGAVTWVGGLLKKGLAPSEERQIGVENKFYYDDDAGRWKLRGEENEKSPPVESTPPPSLPPPPPPPPFVSTQVSSAFPSTSSRLYVDPFATSRPLPSKQ